MARKYFTLAVVILLAGMALGQDPGGDPQPSQGDSNVQDAPPMGSPSPIQSQFEQQWPDSNGTMQINVEETLTFSGQDAGMGPWNFGGAGGSWGQTVVNSGGATAFSTGSQMQGGWTFGNIYVNTGSLEMQQIAHVMPLVLMASGGRTPMAKFDNELATMRGMTGRMAGTHPWYHESTWDGINGNHLVDELRKWAKTPGPLQSPSFNALQEFKLGQRNIYNIIRSRAALQQAFADMAKADPRNEFRWSYGIAKDWDAVPDGLGLRWGKFPDPFMPKTGGGTGWQYGPE